MNFPGFAACRIAVVSALLFVASTVTWAQSRPDPVSCSVGSTAPGCGDVLSRGGLSAGSAVGNPWDSQLEASLADIRKDMVSRSHALVLGIDTFDNSPWERLGGVLPEVRDTVTVLKRHGFEVTHNMALKGADWHLPHYTARQLEDRIETFLKTLHDPDARVVIYIATHGHREPGGIGYLVASDSPDPGHPDFAKRAFSVRDLARKLADVVPRHVFLFFNSCFSGAMIPMIESRGLVNRTPDARDATLATWVQKLRKSQTRLVLTAGSDEQKVPDHDNPFARAFRDGLMGAADHNGDGLILGTELAEFIRTRVAMETHQPGKEGNDPFFAVLPRFDPKTNRFDSVMQGNFVFVSPRGPAVAGATRPSVADMLATLRERLPPATHIDCVDCPTMVRMPGDAGTAVARTETTSVQPEPNTMAGIAVARTETTLAQWDACWRDLGCRSYIDDHGRGRGDRPAGGITWQDAQDYIAWLNRRSAEDVSSACDRYRLPTSAEWEKAARATATTPLPWGSSVLPGRAHCRDCGSPFAADAAAPAASFPPNDFGLHDMIGNLWEWTEDPDNPCRAEAGYAGCAPGLAKGGGFSTAASHLSIMLGGPMLRGPARGPMGYRYPSLGLRVVCEMKRKN